jgi:SOS-response transcriptional repressor LexA
MENVAAGPPIAQSEDLSDFIKVSRKFLKEKKLKPENCYAVHVIGESMTEIIPDGSTAIIRRSDVPKNGFIQVVQLRGKSTLKRMREHEDNWAMHYEDGTGLFVDLKNKEYQIQGDFVDILPEEGK